MVVVDHEIMAPIELDPAGTIFASTHPSQGKERTMFDITLLEFAQFLLFLVKGLATVGLFFGVPVALDWIVTDFSGEHIIPLVLAAITWVNLRYFRTYKGTHRMPMTMDRAKARAQREIDRVWLEADWDNIKFDLDRERVTWNWL